MPSIETTTSCTIIRIRGGIVLRINEMMRFERATTTVTDNAITTAGFSCAVTAKQEQIPNTCTVTGLFLFHGIVINFQFLLLMAVGCLQPGFRVKVAK